MSVTASGKMVPFCFLSPQAAGPWGHPSWSATTASRQSISGVSRPPGQKFRRGNERHGRAHCQAAEGQSAMTGPDCPIRKGREAPRPGLLYAFLNFRHLSYVWRPFMRAGLFPSRFCFDPATWGHRRNHRLQHGVTMPNDVYFQIGLLITLGLTTKNAILIVQFAKARVDEGARFDRGDTGSREIAATADHHDFAGVWFRCFAPGHFQCGAGSRERKTPSVPACLARNGDLDLSGNCFLRRFFM